MANNIFYVKRTTVTGRTPNTTASYATNSQYIATGELALNLTDFKMFTSNGTTYYEIGANLVNHNVTNNFTFSPLLQVNTTAMYVNSAIFLGGSNGTVGQVLTSNGTSNAYWSTVSGGGGGVGSSVNTEILFNDSGSVNGSLSLVFNKTTNTITVANNLTVLGNATINTTGFTIGNSSVNVAINASSIAITNSTANINLNIPTAAQISAATYYLNANGQWVTVSGGGGTPGGSNTDIQYNNSGSFAGSGGIFTYNYVTSTVTANNLSIVGNATINTTVFTIGNSTGNTTISANGISIDNTSPNTSFQLTVTGNSYLQGSVVLANGFPGQIYAVAVGFALV